MTCKIDGVRQRARVWWTALLVPLVSAAELPPLGMPVTGGMVTTSEPAAARVGVEILRRGGNAVDAAVAVAYALSVVEPQSSGIGGGGFMIIHLADSQQTVMVDSRERAPAAADPEMFLDSAGKPFPFEIRSTSGISVGVPGMVRGTATAVDRWGTMKWSELLKPAILLAEGGFYVTERLSRSAESARLDNEPGNPAYEVARSVFRPGGVALEAHRRLVQADLAKTLRILAETGANAFYSGDIAAAIVATQLTARSVADSTDRERLRGRMFLQDLTSYEIAVRQPVEGSYRGYRILSAPPPSSGGITAIQILKLVERFPLGDAEAGFGFGATRTLSVMLEAMRLGFADRAVWIGDDDFVSVPTAGLLSRDYVATRSALIDPNTRRDRVAAADPRQYMDGAGAVAELAARLHDDNEGWNTTHFTIVDGFGNIVTYTNTIESMWGTGLMVPGFGFLLNNELTDFNATPAFNADTKAYDPGANDAAPLKRPRSSMAPTIIFDGQRPLVAFGSPGGSTIINSVVNVAVNLIDHRLPLGEAVDAPRVSQTSANGSPLFEAGFDPRVISELQAMGHDLRDDRMAMIGSVQAVTLDPAGRGRYGAADRRRTGAVRSMASAPSATDGQREEADSLPPWAPTPQLKPRGLQAPLDSPR